MLSGSLSCSFCLCPLLLLCLFCQDFSCSFCHCDSLLLCLFCRALSCSFCRCPLLLIFSCIDGLFLAALLVFLSCCYACCLLLSLTSQFAKPCLLRKKFVLLSFVAIGTTRDQNNSFQARAQALLLKFYNQLNKDFEVQSHQPAK